MTSLLKTLLVSKLLSYLKNNPQKLHIKTVEITCRTRVITNFTSCKAIANLSSPEGLSIHPQVNVDGVGNSYFTKEREN